MTVLGSLPYVREGRNALVTLGLYVAAIYDADKEVQAVLANDVVGLALAEIPVGGAAVVVVNLKDWRRGLYLNRNLWLLLGTVYRLRRFPKSAAIAQSRVIARQA